MKYEEKDRKIRQIADKWGDAAGNWRTGDYFDLISKFLIAHHLTENFIEFTEGQIAEQRENDEK
jgi:hypothetical protein